MVDKQEYKRYCKKNSIKEPGFKKVYCPDVTLSASCPEEAKYHQ